MPGLISQPCGRAHMYMRAESGAPRTPRPLKDHTGDLRPAARRGAMPSACCELVAKDDLDDDGDESESEEEEEDAASDNDAE